MSVESLTKTMGQSELDTLISAFTAPMPNQKVIITDYEAKERKKKSNKNNKGKQLLKGDLKQNKDTLINHAHLASGHYMLVIISSTDKRIVKRAVIVY